MVRVFASFQDPAHFSDFRGHVRGWLRHYLEHRKRHGYGMYAVLLKEDGVLIGDCGLEFYEEIGGGPEVEIAYELDLAFWHRAYATEAAAAVRDYAFGPLGLRRIACFISEDNGASRRVAAKTGLVFERRILKDGQELLLYALETPARTG